MQAIRLLDIKLFYFINHAFRNVVFDYIMPFLTEMGSVRFALGIGLICLFFRKREIKLNGIFLLAAVFVGSFFVGYLKNLFNVLRPYGALEDFCNHIGTGDYSFPSGHATIAFLLAVIISLRFRRKVFIYLLALIVAFSRVYLGVHYPSDVIVGAVLGLIVGYFFVLLYHNIISEGNS